MTMLPFGQVAPITRRAIAYVIDAAIAFGIGIVLGGLLVPIALSAGSPEAILGTFVLGAPLVSLLLFAWGIVYTLMQSGRGSIGMRAQGLRLADQATGARIGFWRALGRNLVFGLAGSIVVGYFTPLFDGSGRFQGWHDKVAGALVLDARVEAPAPVVQVEPEAPAAPLLPAPSFERLPPAPMPGFAPAGAPAAPAAEPAVQAPAAGAVPSETVIPTRPPLPAFGEDPSSLIASVPGITQDPRRRPAAPALAPSAPPAAPVAPPVAPVAPAVPAPAAPAPAASAVASVDDDDIEQTRISVPGHRLVFIWDDGTRVAVSRRTIFGRNPAEEEGALVVPVRDETLSLSKTHFEAAAENAGGWLMDRSSTNGTTVVRDGVHIECPPGERVRIKLGDVITIGDRIVTVGGYE